MIPDKPAVSRATNDCSANPPNSVYPKRTDTTIPVTVSIRHGMDRRCMDRPGMRVGLAGLKNYFEMRKPSFDFRTSLRYLTSTPSFYIIPRTAIAAKSRRAKGCQRRCGHRLKAPASRTPERRAARRRRTPVFQRVGRPARYAPLSRRARPGCNRDESRWNHGGSTLRPHMAEGFLFSPPTQAIATPVFHRSGAIEEQPLILLPPLPA
jgi:hypothetical protein